MDILLSLYKKIIHCPPIPPETGGIIGIRDGVVCDFVYDHGLADGNAAVYIPDIEKLNAVIQSWQTREILFAGIAHTHPVNQPSLSSADIEYIHQILASMPETIEYLFFPIILPDIKILSFKAIRTESGIEILEDKINIIQRRPENENWQQTKRY